MNRKIYIVPQIVTNNVYTLSNIALNVVISNKIVVEEEAVKERKFGELVENYDDEVEWGTIW